MEINAFRLILIIVISAVGLTLIIIGIIYLIKYIKKRKEKKKEQTELSISSTNETTQPSTNISISQNVFTAKMFSEKKFKSREVKINAFCECFLKPVKYDLINIYNDTCPIDLVKFKEDNYISVTKCHHGFHYNCIRKYLFEKEKNKEIKCPICLSVLFVLDDNIS